MLTRIFGLHGTGKTAKIYCPLRSGVAPQSGGDDFGRSRKSQQNRCYRAWHQGR